MSVIIIENAAIKSHKKYGRKNTAGDDPIDDDTVFEAASLSKPVFAYAILQMVQEGLLNLDTPLVEYLSYPELDDKRLNLITARRVLAHSPGFPNWRGKGEPLKIHFQPGEKFSYSGEGYLYLQKVAENLLNQPMEEFMKERVFQPLGMSHSSFIWQKEYEKLKARGHDTEGNPVKAECSPPFMANAAFTLHTTALDYAQFIIGMMKGTGLGPEIMRQMMTPQIQVQESCINSIHKQMGKLSDFISWGLGWGLQHTAQGEAFWHWGDNNGFKCFFMGFKKQKKGILIFTNSSNGLSIISEIIYEFLGTRQPVFDWLDTEKEHF